MQLPPQTVDKLQNAAGLGFDNRFHYQLPTAIPNGDHNRFLVHVHSDIFNVTTHLSCLLGGKVIRANAYLSPKVNMLFFRSTFFETGVNHPESAGSATVSFNLVKRGVLS